ncbi:glycosyltransferase family 2 protein [Microseira wollei]|uniref:Glycosyl transferase family 2 n=1 Tax=Microseira wollei NIES-4236 TaxID=2530354 RepID=A0AAV3X1J8_9CYAN|nr:glycosyltransferase [Microseira wollei]GET35675.1 glycosyl transferase family 2 [Microseira wollei NIES-4236]
MNEQHPYRATLPPVPEGVSRPLWSVMIPTYNCAKYLRETLASVLAQDPGAEVMQIEVVDDRSTQDDPAAVVEELGRGRVGFYQQPQNVGHVKNFQTCLERSRGHLIHLLHGDDCVRPGFYRKLQSALEQKPEIGAAFCRQILMDEQGHWQQLTWLEQPESGVLSNWLERIAVEQRIQTPSIVVRREVYEKLGGFNSRLSWSEDWEMWVRIAAKYPVWYEVEPLAIYRMHSNSSSGRHMRTGENMRDVRRAIEIFQSYLPQTNASQLVNQARENWALDALTYTVPEMLDRGDLAAATIQIQEALKCRVSLNVIRSLLPLILRMGKRLILRSIKS